MSFKSLVFGPLSTKVNSIIENPYRSSHRLEDATDSKLYGFLARQIITLTLLPPACASVWFAYLDAIDEGVPFSMTLFATLVVGLAQLPGLLGSAVIPIRLHRARKVAITTGFLVSMLGSLAYIAYYLHGPEQTTENVAQFHVVVFPVLIVLFEGSILVAGATFVYLSYGQNTQTTISPTENFE